MFSCIQLSVYHISIQEIISDCKGDYSHQCASKYKLLPLEVWGSFGILTIHFAVVTHYTGE